MSATETGFGCEDVARQAIIDACRALNAQQINHGKAGNVSVRWDRGASDGLLITPTAMSYAEMTPDDIVWMSLALAPEGGKSAIVDGVRAPSSEWRMHRDLHASGSRVGAVVHAHPGFASTLSCLPMVQRDGIPAFHYMIAQAGGKDIRCAAYATFGSEALSRHALAALADRRACLLANHGLLVFGATLSAAFALAVEVEALSRMYWQALQIGQPVILDDAEMQRVLARFEGYG